LRQQASEPLALDLARGESDIDTRGVHIQHQTIARVGFAQPQGLQLPSIKIDADTLRKGGIPRFLEAPVTPVSIELGCHP
jgi:hypothetical protein